jgi:putative Mn2+ efflux pump MntP
MVAKHARLAGRMGRRRSSAAQVGLVLGARLGEGAREGAECLAGVALVGVGIFLLAEKVLG